MITDGSPHVNHLIKYILLLLLLFTTEKDYKKITTLKHCIEANSLTLVSIAGGRRTRQPHNNLQHPPLPLHLCSATRPCTEIQQNRRKISRVNIGRMLAVKIKLYVRSVLTRPESLAEP